MDYLHTWFRISPDRQVCAVPEFYWTFHGNILRTLEAEKNCRLSGRLAEVVLDFNSELHTCSRYWSFCPKFGARKLLLITFCYDVHAYFFCRSLRSLKTCIRPVKQFRTPDARYELFARKFGLIMVCHDVYA